MFEAPIEVVRGLAAVFLAVCVGYCSYVAARRIAPRDLLRERYCGFYVCACWLLTMAFDLLIGLGQFNLTAALLLATAGSLAVWRFVESPCDAWMAVRADLRRIWLSIWRKRGTPLAFATAPFAVLAVILLARAMFLPILGWDALTYHGLKAGLWVQNGAPISYDAPGGWEYYRYFFPGGEVFTAWAMLPFHSDLAAGLPDYVHWIFVGVIIYSLAVEMGLGAKIAFVATCFIMFLPPHLDSIGSGYVDEVLNGQLLAAVLFGIKFMRKRRWEHAALACAAMGLAINIKATALTSVALMVLVFLGWFIYSRAWKSISLRAWICCAVVFFAAFMPTWIENARTCGYPLGSTPVAIGRLHLGFMAPNMAWLMTVPGVKSYDFHAEFDALQELISRKITYSGLAASAIGVFGAFWLARKRFWHVSLMCAVIVSVTFNVYQPSFAVVRQYWPAAPCRFLLPAQMLAIILGAAQIMRYRKGRIAYGLFLIVAAYMNIVAYYDGNLTARSCSEIVKSTLSFAVVGGVLFGLFMVFRQIVRRGFWAKTAAATLLLAVSAPVVQEVRDRLRIEAYIPTLVRRGCPLYWVPSLNRLTEEPGNRRIAMTAGPKQVAVQWFVYPFLGSRLENQICYVSPTADGKVVPHHPRLLADAKPDYDAWLRRLQERGVTHVMSFKPTTWELEWMENHGERFTRLAGDGQKWGLYRMESAPRAICTVE